jgi:hypothetical protein
MICLRLILLSIPLFSYSQNADIVTIQVQKLVMKAGEKQVLSIGVTVKDGFHIQANRLRDESLIPATLVIDTAGGITPGKIKFPASKKFKLEGTDSFLDVYDGYIEILVPVKTDKKISKGRHSVHGVFRYQACDAKRCFFPKSLEFIIPAEVIQ